MTCKQAHSAPKGYCLRSQRKLGEKKASNTLPLSKQFVLLSLKNSFNNNRNFDKSPVTEKGKDPNQSSSI